MEIGWGPSALGVFRGQGPLTSFAVGKSASLETEGWAKPPFEKDEKWKGK